jgi:hypothetical protein
MQLTNLITIMISRTRIAALCIARRLSTAPEAPPAASIISDLAFDELHTESPDSTGRNFSYRIILRLTWFRQTTLCQERANMGKAQWAPPNDLSIRHRETCESVNIKHP